MSLELPKSGDSVPAAGDGPGKLLRAARLARGLEPERVASLLHLGERQIEALETDDYSKIPGTVFVRGYLRNYARLLGIDEGPIFEAYSSRLPQGEGLAPLGGVAGPRPVGSGHLGVRLVTGMVVIGLAVLVGLWAKAKLYPDEETTVVANFDGTVPTQGEIPRGSRMFADEGAEPESVAPSWEPGTVETLASSDQEPQEPMEPAKVLGQKVQPATEYVEQPAAGATEPPAMTGASTASSDRTPGPSPAAVDTLAASVETVPSPAGGTSSEALPRVILEFSGPCWVDIKDADGKNRVTGEKRPDEAIELSGIPPFFMVLGNSNAVRMTVDGKPFDLRKYSRGNVARFSFDPGNVSN